MISASEAISIMIRTLLRRWCDHHMVDVSHKFGFDGDTLLFIYCFLCLFDNCSLRHGEFGWFEPTHLSVLAFFFSIFVPSFCFLSLLSQDQKWKRGFQGGSILQQDFQGTRAVQNLFASGEWLWDESARQVNDLSGVPKLERLMLKVPRKRDKWQKWIRVLQCFRFFSEEITRFYRHPNDPWIHWLIFASSQANPISKLQDLEGRVRTARSE